jgi:hypothetical protein
LLLILKFSFSLANLNQAIEYGLVIRTAIVPGYRNEKQLKVADRIVLHGINPLWKYLAWVSAKAK